MALNQTSRRSLILAAMVCATGGFMAGSSRSQVQHGEPTGEIGRYQFSIGQSVAGNHQANSYVIFDTKTARAWEMNVRKFDLDGADVEWYRIPSPLDPMQKVELEKVRPAAAKPDDTPEPN